MILIIDIILKAVLLLFSILFLGNTVNIFVYSMRVFLFYLKSNTSIYNKVCSTYMLHAILSHNDIVCIQVVIKKRLLFFLNAVSLKSELLNLNCFLIVQTKQSRPGFAWRIKGVNYKNDESKNQKFQPCSTTLFQAILRSHNELKLSKKCNFKYVFEWLHYLKN